MDILSYLLKKVQKREDDLNHIPQQNPSHIPNPNNSGNNFFLPPRDPPNRHADPVFPNANERFNDFDRMLSDAEREFAEFDKMFNRMGQVNGWEWQASCLRSCHV